MSLARLLIGVSLVAAVACKSSSLAGPEPERDAGAEMSGLSDMVKQAVGPRTARLLSTATRTEVFRVDAKDRVVPAPGDHDAPGRVSGYRVLSSSPPMSEAFTRRLTTELLDDRTYAPGLQKGECTIAAAIVMRLWSGDAYVDFLTIFPCYRLVFVHRAGDRGSSGEYLDTTRHIIEKLAQEAFAPDPNVARLLVIP